MRVLFYSIMAMLLPAAAYSHGVPASDKARMIEGGYLDYIYLGAKHMITGYDHLLFIFGVIFFLTKFKDIVKFITAFTIGHSITLVFATFYEINASEYLIDAVIALSVCYKGFENLDGFKKVLKIRAPNLLLAVFVFGLIHGFGLSTRLQQLPLGDENLLGKILSFNVGVEIGQIIALSIILLVLNKWRTTASFQKFSIASNKILIALGLVLFVYQIVGFINSPKYVPAPPHAHHHHSQVIPQQEPADPNQGTGTQQEAPHTHNGVPHHH